MARIHSNLQPVRRALKLWSGCLFVLLFLGVNVFAAPASALSGKILVVVPAVRSGQLSPDFLSVLQAVNEQWKQTGSAGPVAVFSEDPLSAKFARIILISYGVPFSGIRMLTNLELLESGPGALNVFGQLQAKDEALLRTMGIRFLSRPVTSVSPRPQEPFDLPDACRTAIVVLGTRPLDESAPSLDMVRRVEAGVDILHKEKDGCLVFSGGRTLGPISEAKMMALIAESRGGSPSRMMLEENAKNTQENAKFTAEIVKKMKLSKTVLVSRSTHLPRAEKIFKKYPVFSAIRTVPNRITKQEIIENFSQYLVFNPDEKNLRVLTKILDQFDRAAAGKAAVKQKKKHELEDRAS